VCRPAYWLTVICVSVYGYRRVMRRSLYTLHYYLGVSLCVCLAVSASIASQLPTIPAKFCPLTHSGGQQHPKLNYVLNPTWRTAAIWKKIKLSYRRNRRSDRNDILHSDAQRRSAPFQLENFILNINPRCRTTAILTKIKMAVTVQPLQLSR